MPPAPIAGRHFSFRLVLIYGRAGARPRKETVMRSPSSRVAALLPLVFACAPVAAQQPAPLVAPVVVPPQVVTSGRGEAKLAPDRATIEVGVQTRAATAAAAAADNARKQRAVIDTLRKLGLAQEQISTVNF